MGLVSIESAGVNVIGEYREYVGYWKLRRVSEVGGCTLVQRSNGYGKD